MSDRIAVMDGGHVLQVGSPRDVYEEPGSRFVAGFVGVSNLLELPVAKSAGDVLTLARRRGLDHRGAGGGARGGRGRGRHDPAGADRARLDKRRNVYQK